MMKSMFRSFAFLALASTLVACGGKSPTAPETPVVPQPIEDTVTGTVSSFNWVQHSMTAPRSGNLTVTLTWSGGGDLDLYLTNAACNQYPKGNCTILAASDAAFGAQEVVRRTISQGETFKVWVDNFALFPISYTLKVRTE